MSRDVSAVMQEARSLIDSVMGHVMYIGQKLIYLYQLHVVVSS
jgi:hypothetical protein